MVQKIVMEELAFDMAYDEWDRFEQIKSKRSAEKNRMSRNIWMRLHKSFLTQADREWQEIRRKV